MNEDRRALADLLARLHGVGVENALWPGCGKPECPRAECWATEVYEEQVLRILSEMMNLPTPGITMGDVLTAAKRAGVY